MTEPEAAGTRRLTFLGTGTSTGVPMIGCDCSVCTSSDPRNQRTRPSVLLSFPRGNLLVDTTPEMRIQLLRERVRHVHAIAFTHHHADHLFGLDDARLFPRWIGGPVPVYCEQETEETIRRVFSYAFRPGHGAVARGLCAQARVRADRARRRVRGLGPDASCRSGSITGRFRSWGFGSARLPIAPTSAGFPTPAGRMLEGLDVLVLDALRHEPHPTHFSLSEALAVVEVLKPRHDVLDASFAQLRSWPDPGRASRRGGVGLRWASSGILNRSLGRTSRSDFEPRISFLRSLARDVSRPGPCSSALNGMVRRTFCAGGMSWTTRSRRGWRPRSRRSTSISSTG